VQQSSLTLISLETIGTPPQPDWRRWTLRQDFDASKRNDAHFLLDATHGLLSFGDGEKGRVPQPDAAFFALYNWTRAEAGNLPGHETMQFLDGPHNRALIPNFDNVIKEFQRVTNAISSIAGAPAETLDGAATRAIKMLNQTNRAVTLKDYQRLALATPGAQLARAEARANRHPSFPCLKAPGLITLCVLPNMPVPRPTPSAGLKGAVASYLQPKRVIGTRVVVVGPDYLEISVQAKVRAFAGVARGNLQQKIVAALNNFLHPLTGGPQGTGWPLGRDLYRSEVMQLIDQIVGVDNVVSLELVAGGCGPQCGNICLGPTSLIAAGDHLIEVI
jgi:predicted phage baseplate assembly protein